MTQIKANTLKNYWIIDISKNFSLTEEIREKIGIPYSITDDDIMYHVSIDVDSAYANSIYINTTKVSDIENFKFDTSDKLMYISVSPLVTSEFNVKLSVSPYCERLRDMYDVNSDGSVNSADVTTIYNYIENGEKSGIPKSKADVNDDGIVNTSDVQAVYNYILNGGTVITTITFNLSFKPCKADISNPNYGRADNMMSQNTSYAILRVNPKLTGNIKLVVDSDENIFLDTFKTSETLSQKRFRKIKINPDGYYGKSVMSFMKSVPSTDFYRVEQKCYTMFSTTQSYESQYYDTYNYGVRTNGDRLYAENFSYLAPLKINETMPDFFLIFKVDVNTESDALNDTAKFNYFLRHGKLVKSFDFRINTTLGTYIRKIYDNAKDVPGDIFVAYDTKNYNKFNGISIDRGTVTSCYESVFSEIDNTNQVALNDFYTLGFERNRLVSKDIINFEFMFDDPDSEMFEANTYFGLYVKMNDAGEFTCINTEDGLKFYGNHETFADSDTISENGSYGNVIYGISSKKEFHRLRSTLNSLSEDDKKYVDYYAGKPYRNVCTPIISQETASFDASYITVQFNKLMEVGDHYRIIIPKTNEIFEVICTNNNDFLTNNISEVSNNVYITQGGGIYYIHRVSMYIGYRDDAEETIKEQVERLRRAFMSFTSITTFNSYILSDNTLSIVISAVQPIFERICATSGLETDQHEALKSSTEENDTVTFFGGVLPTQSYLDVLNSSWSTSSSAYLYPIHFEIAGDRIAYIMNFKAINANDKIYLLGNVTANDIEDNNLIYKKADGSFSTIEKTIVHSINVLSDGISYTDIQKDVIQYYDGRLLVSVVNPDIQSNRLPLYTMYPLTSGICSILPIKDFVYDVLDSKSVSTYSSDTAIGTPGEFAASAFDDSVARYDDEESFCNYIDKNDSYRSKYNTFNNKTVDLSNGVTDETRGIYYNALYKALKTQMSTSLTSPYTCKWCSIGTDSRGKKMRIMQDFSNLVHSSNSYYVVSDISGRENYTPNNTFIGYLTVPDKSSTQSNFEKYVKSSIDSVVSADTPVSLKNDILNGKGSLSSLIYGTGDSYDKFSKAYPSTNGIEFISAGVKIKISALDDNIVDMPAYSGYLATFVAVPELNRDYNTPCELIIDEIHKELALIWYQGSDGLEYKHSLNGTYNTFYSRIFHTRKLDDNSISYISQKQTLETPLSDTTDEYKSFINSCTNLILASSENEISTYVKHNKFLCMSDDISISNDTILSHDLQLFINGTSTDATNSNISKYADSYYSAIDSFCVFDGSINPPIKTLASLKTDVNNCSILIKKASGCCDLTRIANAIKISIEDPYVATKYTKNSSGNVTKDCEGIVLPTYAEPMMKDMIEFKYSCDPDINDAFSTSFDGANILPKKVNTINQLWINKYTTESDYCISTGWEKLSFDVLHNVSIMQNAWSAGKYRKYYTNNGNDESYDSFPGYSTGYEPNCFINSRGISFNSTDGTLTIGSWKNTKVIEKSKCIKFNITDSIIYLIRFSNGYKHNWDYIKSTTDTYKSKYIKNTILNYINITSDTKFDIYMKPNSETGYTVDTYTDNIPNTATKVDVKHELHYEKGKYYMYIYPESKGTYFAKMTINI